MRSVPSDSLPHPLNHFKTYTVFYSGGRGFWVLYGDGTNPPQDQAWHPLRFDNTATDKTSYLTQTGNGDTLRCHRSDQLWAHMLLPNIYHGPRTQNLNHGGLTGELPIFLALIAMSMEPTNLQSWLTSMFTGQRWQTHSLPNGCMYAKSNSARYLATSKLIVNRAA